jgi:hypothetical protein
MEIHSYGVAQICRNGHILTDQADTHDLKQKYCSFCGSPIISQCEHCQADIKGKARYVSQITNSFGYYNSDACRPAFCIHCGKPYPWTEQSKETIQEIIRFSDALNEVEKEDFQSVVPDLIVDTPRTPVALLKFKAYTGKAGKEIGKMIKDILTDVAAEVIKKAIIKE